MRVIFCRILFPTWAPFESIHIPNRDVSTQNIFLSSQYSHSIEQIVWKYIAYEYSRILMDGLPNCIVATSPPASEVCVLCSNLIRIEFSSKWFWIEISSIFSGSSFARSELDFAETEPSKKNNWGVSKSPFLAAWNENEKSIRVMMNVPLFDFLPHWKISNVFQWPWDHLRTDHVHLISRPRTCYR